MTSDLSKESTVADRGRQKTDRVDSLHRDMPFPRSARHTYLLKDGVAMCASYAAPRYNNRLTGLGIFHVASMM